MKIKKFNNLQLRKFEVPFFAYNFNPQLSESELIPIEENLDLKAFLQTKREDTTEFRLGLILKTAEKEKSKVDFAVLCFFHFKAEIPITGEREEEARYVATALSISYSTLRGYLFQKFPDLGLLPLISISELYKALEEGTKEISS